MPMTEVVEESLKADARFRHLTVMPKRLEWSSSPKWASWLVRRTDGSEEWLSNYPIDDDVVSISSRPSGNRACERCGPCRRMDFDGCRNRS